MAKNIDQKNFVIGGCQGTLHRGAQFHRHGRFDLKPDDRAFDGDCLSADLEQANEIFGLLSSTSSLGCRANDAECALPLKRHSRGKNAR